MLRPLAVLAAALALAAPALAQPARGPDVSNNNGCSLNWRAVHAAGFDFAFAKANEGTGFTDRCFGQGYGQMQHEGLVRGAYDFAHLNQDPVAEAHLFLRVVKAAGGLNRAIAVIDVEANPGRSVSANRVWVQRWLDTVLVEGHPAKLLVYTAPFFWNPYLGCWRPRGAGLWVATYGPRPSIPCGWGGYDFWQYTSNGLIPGVGHGDVSVFSGDLPSLLSYTLQVPQHAYGSRVIRLGATGTDVRGLQDALNKRLAGQHRKHRLKVDATWGTHSDAERRHAEYRLGMTAGAIRSRGVGRRAQVVIAHPNKRTSNEKHRAARRSRPRR